MLVRLRPTTRHLFGAAVLLSLGFATSWTVAWALAAWSPLARERLIKPPGGTRSWVYDCIYSSRGFGAERRSVRPSLYHNSGLVESRKIFEAEAEDARLNLVWGVEDGTFPSWWGSPTQAEPPSPSHLWAGVRQDAHGWPLPALWCEWTHWIDLQAVEAGKPPRTTVLRGGHAISDRNGIARALPLRPVWLGLGANTLIYAAVWWVACYGRQLMRRGLRRRRGLCSTCGYSRAGLAGDAACPECGTCSPPRTAASSRLLASEAGNHGDRAHGSHRIV